MFIRLRTLLFGYDFFICYRTADASVFARSLRAKLHTAGFDCFLDVQHYEAGQSLPRMQSAALRHSTKLLVLVSPRAHLSPEESTDWVLAEIREFAAIARERGAAPKIVPIGTSTTFSATYFPQSKLLPEIPTPGESAICIFDEAIERDAEPDTKTIDKLDNDFTEARRRRTRVIAAVAAMMVTLCAIGFGISSLVEVVVARTETELVSTFRLIDRGREQMELPGADVEYESAESSFSAAADKLRQLGKDPLLALHGQFAVRARQLQAAPITEVSSGAAAYLRISDDGNWVFVGYDYSVPRGGPDIEDMPENLAFGVFNLLTRQWSLEQPLATEIGRRIYQAHPSEVLRFEPPHYVILDETSAEQSAGFFRVSLVDGTMVRIDRPIATPPDASEGNVRAAIYDHLPYDFFAERPDDVDPLGDRRLIERLVVASPDGRTAVAGNFEGRLVLLDLVTGARRELKTNTIYAAAYGPDSQRACFCDINNLWEIDAAGWPGIHEIQLAMRTSFENAWRDEKVLATVMDEGSSALAIATTERIFYYETQEGTWREWPLPSRVESFAALRIDIKRARIDLVVADDGAIISVKYDAASATPDILPRPGGPMATIAWLDSEAPSAWLAGVQPVDGAVHVHAVCLPDETATARAFGPIRLRPETSPGDDRLKLHALAKRGENIILFHGDDAFYREDSDLLSEEITVVSLDGNRAPARRVVFSATSKNLGEVVVNECVQVSRVLPGQRGEALLVAAGIQQDVYAIDLQKPVEKAGDGLSVREHRDGAESYLIRLASSANSWEVHVRHDGTGTDLSYSFPWRSAYPPKFGVIAKSGLQGMLASARGHLLLFNIAGSARPVRGSIGN